MWKVPPCSGKKEDIFINTDREKRAEKSVQANLIIKLTLVFLVTASSFTTPSPNSSAFSILHKCTVSLSKGIRVPCSGHLLGSSFLSRCLCTWKNSIKCICFYPASLSWKFVKFHSSQGVKENLFLSLYHLALISTLIIFFWIKKPNEKNAYLSRTRGFSWTRCTSDKQCSGS